MKRISVAIEVADENLCAQEMHARVEMEYGLRTVLNSAYADKLVLAVPEPIYIRGEEFLPPVRMETLKTALRNLGVAVTTPRDRDLDEALMSGAEKEAVSARKRLRLMFREFKSNPLYHVSLRGKDPADPVKLQRKLKAKRFKEDFYTRLSEFIAENPRIPWTDYWDADDRPRGKQWPEYRAAVKRVKEMSAE